MFVVAELKSDRQAPRRIEGNVVVTNSTITITHRQKGEGKDTVEVFEANKVAAYLKGEAGFVVVQSGAPIAKIAGELVVKGDVRAIKTESGNVILSDVTGVVVDIKQVDSDSREARVAERASKVKVRPSRGGEKPAAAAERPARAAKPEKAKEAAAPARSAKLRRRQA